MAPHSLTLTMVGTGLLWVGWFGFNAGSALEANGSAGLAMINTFVATASAALFWMLAERAAGHKASALGFCSGIVAGLVAVTPAAGNSGPFGAIVLGAVASVVCFFAVTVLKPRLGYDDTLDAFGIHGIGGIVGAIGTAVVYAPSLGGPGAADYDMGAKLLVQTRGGRRRPSCGPRIGTVHRDHRRQGADRWPCRSRSRAGRPRPRRARRTRLQYVKEQPPGPSGPAGDGSGAGRCASVPPRFVCKQERCGATARLAHQIGDLHAAQSHRPELHAQGRG